MSAKISIKAEAIKAVVEASILAAVLSILQIVAKGCNRANPKYGFTLGTPASGKIVVMTGGLCPLADEKAARAELQRLDPSLQFSRTLDIGQRCEDYTIFANAAELRKAKGKTTAKAETPKTDATPEPITPPVETKPEAETVSDAIKATEDATA